MKLTHDQFVIDPATWWALLAELPVTPSQRCRHGALPDNSIRQSSIFQKFDSTRDLNSSTLSNDNVIATCGLAIWSEIAS